MADVAQEIAYRLEKSEQFSQEHQWRGYIEPRKRDNNQKCKHSKFEQLGPELLKLGITCQITSIKEGGNDYYDEPPEQVGYKVVCKF